MFFEKSPYSAHVLSQLTDCKIMYMTTFSRLQFRDKEKQNKDLLNSSKKNHLLCVCEERIITFKKGLEGIKFEILYDNIVSIGIDMQFERIFQINLKNSINGISCFNFSVDNRNKLVEKLKCYYNIYYTQKFGTYVEIKIIYEKNLLKLETHLLETKVYPILNDFKRDEIGKKTPPGFAMKSYSNYFFYLKKDYESKDTSTFFYPSTNVRFTLEIFHENPIEHLNSNSDIQDFSFYVYDKFFYIMRTTFKFKFCITSNSAYVKKMNLIKDPALWEAWKIECRTNQVGFKGLNLVFIFLRRKYIPPLYETYQEMILTLVEEYDETNLGVEISPKSMDIIEMAADSLTSEETYPQFRDGVRYIENKLDSLLVQNHSLDFFFNDMKIYGKESYKLGLIFTYKIIQYLAEFLKEKVALLKEKVLKRIFDFSAISSDTKLKKENFEKFINNNDFDQIILNNDLYFDNLFTTAPNHDAIIQWQQKRLKFLVNCLNGSLTFNLLDLRRLVAWVKGIPELKSLNQILFQLLDIKVTSVSDEPIEPRINHLVNKMYNIKELHFNEDLMAILIENDYLRIMQEVESEYVYTEFLKYLLENHFSNKLFSAIYFYLKSMVKTKISDDSGNKQESDNKNSVSNSAPQSSAAKSGLNNLLPFIYKIYSNYLLSPTMITMACKCLIFLTHFDKFNKSSLLQENCIETICNFLSHADEKLVYHSVELLSIIISEARDSIQVLMKKNPKLLPKTLNFLRGSIVPGCFYSSKMINLISKFIVILLSMPNSGVKETFCQEKNRKYVKYLFSYLQDTGFTLPKDVEQTLLVQQKIFEILEFLVNKNTEFRRYLEDQYKILRLIDSKCEDYILTILYYMGMSKNPNSNILDNAEAYLNLIQSIIKFLKKFISNDLQIVKNIRLYCVNLVNLLSLIYENQKSESLKQITNSSGNLFEILFN
jgi:hypothetical protein